MFSVQINGFKTIQEAKQFLNWYEGQGEQDICTWLECRQQEGQPVRTCLNIDINVPYHLDGNTLIAEIKE